MGSSSQTVTLKFNGDISGASKAMSELSGKSSKTAGEVEGHFSKLGGKLSSTFGQFLGPFQGAFDKLITHVSGGFDKLSSGKGLSGLQELGKATAVGFLGAGIAAAGYSLKLGESLQKADSDLAAHADISQAQATKIGDAFGKSAFKVTFSSEEQVRALTPVAQQLEEVDGKSLSAANAQKFMAGAMDLAEASGGSLNETTASLAAVMQAYGIQSKDAGQATDVLWGASQRANIPVGDLATALDKLHGKLGENAPSLQDSAALMSELAETGLKGKAAMSVVTSSLDSLYAPSKQAEQALRLMHVSMTDATGAVLPLGDVIGQLHAKFSKLTPEQAKNAAVTLFGKGNWQAMLQVIDAGPVAFGKATDAVSKNGSAHDAAEKATNNWHSTLKKLQAGLKDVAANLGEKLIPVLNKGVQFLVKHKTAVEIFAAVVGAVLVAAFLSWAASAAIAAAATLVAMAPLLLIVGAVALVGYGIFQLATHWHQVWSDIKQWTMDGVNWIKQHLYVLIGIVGLPIVAIVYLATHWKQLWNDLKQWASDGIHFLMGIFDAGWSFIKGLASDAWDAIVGFFRSGISGAEHIVTGGVASIVGFFVGLPGRIIDAIGDLLHIGAKIAGDVASAVGSGVHAVWDWFVGLPDRIIGAIGDLAGIGVHIVQGIISGIGSMAGAIASKLSSLIPSSIGGIKMPWAAEGAYVDRPTIMGVGEAGAEVIIPLTNPHRAAELAAQSGLLSVVARGMGAAGSLGPRPSGGSTPAAAATPGRVVNITNNITGVNLADPHRVSHEIAWTVNMAGVAA